MSARRSKPTYVSVLVLLAVCAIGVLGVEGDDLEAITIEAKTQQRTPQTYIRRETPPDAHGAFVSSESLSESPPLGSLSIGGRRREVVSSVSHTSSTPKENPETSSSAYSTSSYGVWSSDPPSSSTGSTSSSEIDPWDSSSWPGQGKSSGRSSTGSMPSTPTSGDSHGEVVFNCYSSDDWSTAKRNWCCENKNIGCPRDASEPQIMDGMRPIPKEPQVMDGMREGPRFCKEPPKPKGKLGCFIWKCSGCLEEDISGTGDFEGVKTSWVDDVAGKQAQSMLTEKKCSDRKTYYDKICSGDADTVTFFAEVEDVSKNKPDGWCEKGIFKVHSTQGPVCCDTMCGECECRLGPGDDGEADKCCPLSFEKVCVDANSIGCKVEAEDHTMDCDAGLRNWQKGWSKHKKQFCCEKERKGCEVEYEKLPDTRVPPEFVLIGSGTCLDTKGEKFARWVKKGLPAPLCEELCITIPECVGITITNTNSAGERECAVHTEGGKNPDYGGTWDEARLDDVHSGTGMPAIASEEADAKCFMRRPGAISAKRPKARPTKTQPPHWNGENQAKKKDPPVPPTRPATGTNKGNEPEEAKEKGGGEDEEEKQATEKGTKGKQENEQNDKNGAFWPEKANKESKEGSTRDAEKGKEKKGFWPESKTKDKSAKDPLDVITEDMEGTGVTGASSGPPGLPNAPAGTGSSSSPPGLPKASGGTGSSSGPPGLPKTSAGTGSSSGPPGLPNAATGNSEEKKPGIMDATRKIIHQDFAKESTWDKEVEGHVDKFKEAVADRSKGGANREKGQPQNAFDKGLEREIDTMRKAVADRSPGGPQIMDGPPPSQPGPVPFGPDNDNNNGPDFVIVTTFLTEELSPASSVLSVDSAKGFEVGDLIRIASPNCKSLTPLFCSEVRSVVTISSGISPAAMLQTERGIFIEINKPTLHTYPKKSKVSKVKHPRAPRESDECKQDCRVDDGCCSDGCVVQQQCFHVDPANGLVPPNVYTAQKLCGESNGNWCPGDIIDAALANQRGTLESFCEKNCNVKDLNSEVILSVRCFQGCPLSAKTDTSMLPKHSWFVFRGQCGTDNGKLPNRVESTVSAFMDPDGEHQFETACYIDNHLCKAYCSWSNKCTAYSYSRHLCRCTLWGGNREKRAATGESGDFSQSDVAFTDDFQFIRGNGGIAPIVSGSKERDLTNPEKCYVKNDVQRDINLGGEIANTGNCDNQAPPWAASFKHLWKVKIEFSEEEPKVYYGLFSSPDCSGELATVAVETNYRGGDCPYYDDTVTLCWECVEEDGGGGEVLKIGTFAAGSIWTMGGGPLVWQHTTRSVAVDPNDHCGGTCLSLGSLSMRVSFHSKHKEAGGLCRETVTSMLRGASDVSSDVSLVKEVDAEDDADEALEVFYIYIGLGFFFCVCCAALCNFLRTNKSTGVDPDKDYEIKGGMNLHIFDRKYAVPFGHTASLKMVKDTSTTKDTEFKFDVVDFNNQGALVFRVYGRLDGGERVWTVYDADRKPIFITKKDTQLEDTQAVMSCQPDGSEGKEKFKVSFELMEDIQFTQNLKDLTGEVVSIQGHMQISNMMGPIFDGPRQSNKQAAIVTQSEIEGHYTIEIIAGVDQAAIVAFVLSFEQIHKSYQMQTEPEKPAIEEESAAKEGEEGEEAAKEGEGGTKEGENATEADGAAAADGAAPKTSAASGALKGVGGALKGVGTGLGGALGFGKKQEEEKKD